jgi:single-strand DNA-binding protein
MNRITATGHLTREPELVTTSGGTEICQLRLAVKRAGRDGQDGYFEVKAFGSQAKACAEYLSKGREIGLDGRLRFEEFKTRSGGYASRVYLVADSVEFLDSRPRTADQGDNGQQADAPDQPDNEAQPAAAGSDQGEPS